MKLQYTLAILCYTFIISCKINEIDRSHKTSVSPDVIFNAMDELHSGHVDIDKWRRVYGDTPQSSRLFEHYDRNKDKYLEREEFIRVYRDDNICAEQYKNRVNEGDLKNSVKNACYINR